MFQDTDGFYIDLARKNGVTEEITRVEREVPPLHGEHFASACISVTIHRKDAPPLELFVKKWTQNPYNQQLIKEMGIFDKEAGFFNVLLPELQRIVDTRPDQRLAITLPVEFRFVSHVFRLCLLFPFTAYRSSLSQRQDVSLQANIL